MSAQVLSCLNTYLLCITIAGVTMAQHKQAVLIPVAKCPSSASLSLMSAAPKSLQDLSTCAVECASSDLCSVMHFSTVNSRCYHGNADQLAALWDRMSVSQSDGCASFEKYMLNGTPSLVSTTAMNPTSSAAKRTTTLNAVPTTIPGESSYVASLSENMTSKLVIFFDFRQGFNNLVNPTKFNATPRGSVTRDSEGAHFPGSSLDFIDVDTDGNTLVSNYLNYPHNFTFFVRLVRQTWSKQTYHYFHDCSGNLRGEFGDQDGRLWVSHSFSNQTDSLDKIETIQSLFTNLARTDNTPSQMSAAAIFTGIHFSTFYFNGTVTAGSSDLNYAFQGLPLCLRLGFNSATGSALKGLFICYGIAKAALSSAEIAELNQFCG